MVQNTNAVAIDCEMVGAGQNGSINMVAKVSIVNEYEQCLLDTYVEPRYEVTDYRTWVSGIQAYHLNGAPPINQVRIDVANIIRGGLLVGHDLDKDLKVLGLCHPEWKKRDTSVYFREKFKPSLKYLARHYLGRHIQNGMHNSVTDARTTMALYKMYEKEWEDSFESSSEEEEQSNNEYYDSSSSSDY